MGLHVFEIWIKAVFALRLNYQLIERFRFKMYIFKKIIEIQTKYKGLIEITNQVQKVVTESKITSDS